VEGEGIRLWKEIADGRPKVPNDDLLPLAPQHGRNFNEVCKVIDGFINLWVQWLTKTYLENFGE